VLPLIYNEAPSDWSLVNIVSLSDPPALDETANSTLITVRAVDDENAPLTGYDLQVQYSDNSSLVAPIEEVTTDGTGYANIPVQVMAGAPNTAFKVSVQDITITNSAPAVVTITYRNATPPSVTRYAGYMTYSIGGSDEAPFLTELGDLDATAHIWYDNGSLAQGNASIVLSTTSAGDLASSDLTPISTNYEGWGMIVATSEDGGAYVTGGPYCTAFDYDNYQFWASEDVGYIYAWVWGDVVPATIENGTLEIPMFGQDVATSDFATQILVVPDGLGYFNGDTLTYEIDGTTSIRGDYAIQRGSHVTTTTMAITDRSQNPTPAIKVPNVGYGSARVYGHAWDENNDPVEGATLGVFQAFLGYARATDFQVIPWIQNPGRPASVVTDGSGSAYMTLVALANNGIGTSGATAWKTSVVPGSTVSVAVTAKASVPGTISLFAIERSTFVVQQGLLKIDPITEVTQIGEKVVVTARLTDILGNGVPNIQVIMTVSGGAILETPTLGTDATGKAVFTIDTSQMGAVKAAYITVSGSAAGAGFTIASCQLAVPMRNPGPSVYVGSPVGDKVDSANVTLQGSASSPLGFASVKVKLDNEATQTVVDTTAATSVALTYDFGELDSGEHTIVVNATDALGVSTEKTVTFTVSKGGTDVLPWAIAGIGWILLVVVVVMMMMKGRKPKAETMAPEAAPPPEQKM
jgi:hypothetical protein